MPIAVIVIIAYLVLGSPVTLYCLANYAPVSLSGIEYAFAVVLNIVLIELTWPVLLVMRAIR